MGSLARFADEAGVRVRRIAGLTLVRGIEAPLLIDALGSAGIRILGVEGFEVEGSEARADMNLIADFSSVTDAEDTAREARQFVARVNRPDAFFEFTIAEDQAGH